MIIDNSYYTTLQGYLQLSHQTAVNRFPKIFETCKKLQPEPRRILSFGCSTGEECFSLAQCFPNAEIVGVDIDSVTLEYARKKNIFPDRIFFHTNIDGTGNYDLITCLMVFFSLEIPVPKDRWIDCIKKINFHLNPGGILVIYTSDYDLTELTDLSSEYQIIRAWKRIHPRNNKEYSCGYYRKKYKPS